MVLTHHTFVFADLVGYTAYTAAEGDLRSAEMALAFHARVRELAAEHGATEVKTTGDGVMLRCDCPERGTRLAVAIVRELGGRDGMLAARSGVCTGPAVGHGGDWYGHAVNLGARLCAAAEEGEALACDATHAAAVGLRDLELERVGPLSLKNVPAPVTAYAARRSVPRTRFTRTPVPAVQPLQATA